eukprot:gene3997-4627_t
MSQQIHDELLRYYYKGRHSNEFYECSFEQSDFEISLASDSQQRLFNCATTTLQRSIILRFTAYAEVLFTASPSDSVELKWSGVASPSQYDCIAIYYPVDTDEQYPIGFVMLATSETWMSGYGSASVPLVNVRDTYVFRLWVPGTQAPTIKVLNHTLSLQATSNSVSFKNPVEPGKAYLALTNTTGEMRVQFISGTSDTPKVYYGTTSNPKTLAEGTTTTYTIDQMCEAPANNPNYWKDPGFIHDVVLTGLHPNTHYYYYFGSHASGYSKLYTFVSAPSVGEEAYFIAYGDLGLDVEGFIGYGAMQGPAPKTIANIYNTISEPLSSSPLAKKLGKVVPGALSNAPPAWNILHIGDISYARGNAWIWQYYYHMMEKVTSMASYMVSVGNHEYDYTNQPFKPSWSNYNTDSGGECGVVFDTVFHMPGAEGPTRNNWYSYINGPVKFVIMSAEHDFTVGSPQYQWIESELKAVDRSKTPFVIFAGHRPMYSSALALNEAGNAGNEYQVPWSGTDLVDGEGHMPQPDFSQFRAINYGFSRFYANKQTLYFEFVGNEFQVPWSGTDIVDGEGHMPHPDFKQTLYFEFVGNDGREVHDFLSLALLFSQNSMLESD